MLSLVPNAAGDAQEMEIAISSELPVERMDWLTGERFLEVLDHSSSAVDLARAMDGLPILLDHNTEKQVGVLEGARVDSDRVIRGTPKYSRSQAGREVQMDVEDGIRKKVSAGYVVREWDKQKPAKRGDLPVWRAVDWMPVEMSHVAIPADPTVGVGRSAGVAAPAVIIPRDTAPGPRSATVSDTSTAATGDGAVINYTNAETGTTGRAAWVESEEQKKNREAVERARRDERMKDVATIAELHGCEGILIAGMRDGKEPDAIQREMVAEVKRRAKEGPKFGVAVDLTPKEQRQYSLVRAINAQASGENCFEMEVSQQIARNTGRDLEHPNAFYFPTTTRAGLYNASTVGAEVVFDEPGSFITLLRNKARTFQLGVTVLSGLRETVTFPEQTSAGTATWVAENPGSDVSDSDLNMTTKSLTPKTLQSSTSFSRQLLRQSVIDVEALVRADIAAIHALAIDLAVIKGTGASNQFTGILTASNVNSYTLGTNGGSPTYAGLVGLEFKVENANANIGPMGYLTSPGIKATLKTTQDFTSNGVAVWTGGEEGRANGYKALSSTQIPTNLTKGTSTTICHAIIFGVWSEFYVGEWGAMEVIVDPYRLKKQGMIEITSFQMVGGLTRRPTSFAKTVDALSSFS